METPEIKIQTLRCPIGTLNTLDIKYFKDIRVFATTDPRTIHMLKQSLLVVIMNQPENNPVIVSEYSPSKFIPDEYGRITIPIFGYDFSHTVWIAPQTIAAFGKNAVLGDLPRVIKRQWQNQLLESRNVRNS